MFQSFTIVVFCHRQSKVDGDFDAKSAEEDYSDDDDEDDADDVDDDDNDDDDDVVDSEVADENKGTGKTAVLNDIAWTFARMMKTVKCFQQRRIRPYKMNTKWLLNWYDSHLFILFFNYSLVIINTSIGRKRSENLFYILH